MLLEELPDEILLEIIDRLARIPSLEFQQSWPDSQYGVSQKLNLIRFSEASRKLHRLARSKIFEAITIKALVYHHSALMRHVLHVEVPYLQPFPSTFDKDNGPLRFMRSIRAAIEVDEERSDHCLHREFWDVSDSSSDSDSDTEVDNQTARTPPPPQDDIDSIEAYGSLIVGLLKFVEPGSLRSFHWDLGMCVPDILFGKFGYIPTYQNKIEYLSLTTDGSCMRSAKKSLPGLNVQNFRSLRGVSWKGLQNYSELNALRLLLDNNASHLKDFELSLLECQYHQSPMEVEISGTMENLLSTTILGLSLPDMRLHFPSLRSLSLSGIQLLCTDVNIQDVISALNIGGLRKLRLLRCDSVAPLLQAILERKTNLRLESLELEVADESPDDTFLYQNTISAFLASFRGLREFYLSTHLFHRPSDIWTALDCHRATLRQLVWHDRRCSLTQDHNFGVEAGALYDMFNDESQFPGQFPHLESVGLGTNCYLKELFEMNNLAFLENIKLLHLRGTWKDLENEGFIEYNLLESDRNDSVEMLSDGALMFARWAFGPRGLPKLQILACGNPCNKDIRQGNWMLMRNTPPTDEPELFCWTSLATCEELVGITNSFEVLSACPIDRHLQ